MRLAKEIEYVLDLELAHIWIVGPGSIGPPAHVFSVATCAERGVVFTSIEGLPQPPS